MSRQRQYQGIKEQKNQIYRRFINHNKKNCYDYARLVFNEL